MFNKSSLGGGTRLLTEQSVSYSVLSVDELAAQIGAEFQEDGITPTIPCEWIAMAELAGLTVDPLTGQITGTEDESWANVLMTMTPAPERFLEGGSDEPRKAAEWQSGKAAEQDGMHPAASMKSGGSNEL